MKTRPHILLAMNCVSLLFEVICVRILIVNLKQLASFGTTFQYLFYRYHIERCYLEWIVSGGALLARGMI